MLLFAIPPTSIGLVALVGFVAYGFFVNRRDDNRGSLVILRYFYR